MPGVPYLSTMADNLPSDIAAKGNEKITVSSSITREGKGNKKIG